MGIQSKPVRRVPATSDISDELLRGREDCDPGKIATEWSRDYPGFSGTVQNTTFHPAIGRHGHAIPIARSFRAFSCLEWDTDGGRTLTLWVL